MKRLRIFSVILIASFLVMTICWPAWGAKTIKIGAIGPMHFLQGKGHWNGALMAEEEINAAGGVKDGKEKLKIEIVKKGLIHCPERRRPFREMTVLKNLYAGAYLVKDKNEEQKNLENVYQLFPVLKDRSNQISGTLSGGEQQMLAVVDVPPQIALYRRTLHGLGPPHETGSV